MAIGVILAGGRGARFNAEKPKQFMPLAGRPILEYAVDTFSGHPEISELVITCPPDLKNEVEQISSRYKQRKPILVIEGGATRAESTRNALRAIGDRGRCKVLFHDGVRPFCSSAIISNTIKALDTADAADVVIETADTIIQIDEGKNELAGIPRRSALRRGQTPQGFWSDQLANAYASFESDALARFTDDCGVLLAYDPNVRIAAVEGADTNIKITRPIDMFLAEQLLYMGEFSGTSLAEDITKDPVALIVGDTSGFGLVVKDALLKSGWRVYGASRANDVDVRDYKAVARRMDDVVKEAGKIDVVANFAGVLHVGSLHDAGQEALDETIAVNLVGSINVARASFHHLRKSKGQLILCSSSSYFRGRKNTAAYSASKAAVVNLTQALAEEWGEHQIAVSCIVPRRADTPMRRKAFPDEDPALCMRPENVAVATEELLRRRQSGMIKHVY